MSILEIAYICVCFIGLAGYGTQIIAIFKPGAMLKSASLKTYTLWTGTCFCTLLYSIYENGDPIFILVSFCNFIGCFLCALAIFYRRKKLSMPIFSQKNKALNPFAGKENF